VLWRRRKKKKKKKKRRRRKEREKANASRNEARALFTSIEMCAAAEDEDGASSLNTERREVPFILFCL